MWWLLEPSVRQAMEQAQAAGIIPTVEQQTEFEASHISALADGGSRILTLAGNSAEISIKGTLTKTPSFLAMLFGGGNTTYPEIVNAIAAAEQDDNITDITLAIDSPGGSFDGLFDALAAIQSANKPVKAVIGGMGASAAYAIASQADTIVASNIASRIGSIGVAASFQVSDNKVTITSTDAPKKRPDVTTPAGVEMVVEELDALHEIFVEAIAKGRGVSIDTINGGFGQGATLLAEDALKRGMIDSVAKTTFKTVETTNTETADSGGDNIKVLRMDLSTLRTTHPEAYAAAVEVGVTQERDRVGQHLIMGESSGDMKTALAACKDGTEMTGVMQSTYMAAGMSRANIAARQDDDAGADAGDGATAEDDAGTDAADAVANLVESKLGIEGED